MKPWSKLRSLFRKTKLDAEMSEEMRLHLELQTERNIAAGMDPNEARYAAQRQFGGVEQIKERCREQRGWVWLEQLLQDVRYGVRQLARSPGFTLVSVLSLSLGIGAGTAIFSMLNAILLRSLPVKAAHELRLLAWSGHDAKPTKGYSGDLEFGSGGTWRGGFSFPYPAYRELRDRCADRVTLFAFYPMRRITVAVRGEARTADGLMVAGNFFSGYGASALIGRTLSNEDDRLGAEPVAVITYRMWERQFGLDPNVLGQTVSLNKNVYTVVGVLPRDFAGPMLGDSAEFYVFFAAQPAFEPEYPLNSVDQGWWVEIMARLPDGVDEQQLSAQLGVCFKQGLPEWTGISMTEPGISLNPGARGTRQGQRRSVFGPMLGLMAVVGAVLAIACANIAGLQLARGAVRQHEFAVRAAVGASRWRLVRQTLTESLLLGLAAAAGGLLLANWGKDVLLQSLGVKPEGFRLDLSTDIRVFVFAVTVSILTALVSGLVPALRASRADPVDGLKSRAGSAAPRLRLGKILVAVQVSLAALLVVGAGLLTRTFFNLVRIDPGFNPTNILLFRVDPGQAGHQGAALDLFYSEASRALAAIPGVRSVAASSTALSSNSREAMYLEIPGRPDQRAQSIDSNTLAISGGFFSTLNIPLLLGRDFALSDASASTPVAIVNETFVRTLFPGENPIGRTFLRGDRVFTIIGLARDAKYTGMREAAPPTAYFSNRQERRGAMVLAIRSVLPPLSLVPAARKTIAAIDPNVPLSAIRTQEQLVERSVAMDRLFAGLCGGLAALAVLLACIGLYGLMAYNVARRTNEIGVRMALGATRRAIAWPIVREALLLAGAGLALGIPATLALTGFVKSQLYGVAPNDPATFVVGAVLLLVVAVSAAFIPARRAAKVDPMIALRCE